MTPPALSREAVASLQARAARGETLSRDELRAYIAATRHSYLAAEMKAPSKSRSAPAPAIEENQVDFF